MFVHIVLQGTDLGHGWTDEPFPRRLESVEKRTLLGKLNRFVQSPAAMRSLCSPCQ